MREIYGDKYQVGKGSGDYLAVTASFDLFKLKMLPEVRNVFEHLLHLGRFWSGEKVIELKDPERGDYWAARADDPMWGRIILRSAQAPGGLESATAKAAWMDECGQDTFGLSSWEAIQRRLSFYQGRVLGCSTPYNSGWLKNEVYDRWIAHDPDYFVVQADSTVNPAFPKEEFERARLVMPSWKFDMFYRGIFARPAGLIYIDFTDDLIIDPFEIPSDWPRYVGIDYGPINTGTIWIAHDVGANRYIVYRETLEGGKTTKEHAKLAKVRRGDENVEKWTGGAPSEDQYRWDWQAEGINVRRPYTANVETGIDRVIGLFRTKQLFVMRHCRGLLDELGTYSRMLDDMGQPTEDIVSKRHYHLCDSLRYDVLSLPVRKMTRSIYAGSVENVVSRIS